MDLFTGLAGLGSFAGGIGSLVNLALQQKTNAQQLDLQKEAWAREDTSIQRRVADLKGAGLSPVLAAGQGASASSPISIRAPQIDTSALTNASATMSQAAQTELALKQQKANIEQTDAQTQAIKLQANKTAMETAFMQANNPIQLDLARNQLELNQAMNPQSIKRAVLENESLGLSNANAKLNNILKELQIDETTVDIINKKIQTDALKLGLTQQETDIAAKQIAIDIATNQYNNRLYDTQWYHKLGLPIDYNIGRLSREAISIAAPAAEAVKKVGKGGR